MTDYTIINEGDSTKYKLVDDHWVIDEHIEELILKQQEMVDRASPMYVGNGGPLSTHFKLDEQAGCKITEIKEQGPSTYDKLISILNDNEAMEAIALEACLEQQKVIDKAKVIKAAYNIIFDNAGASSAQLARKLYDAGCLTLPGEPND